MGLGLETLHEIIETRRKLRLQLPQFRYACRNRGALKVRKKWRYRIEETEEKLRRLDTRLLKSWEPPEGR